MVTACLLLMWTAAMMSAEREDTLHNGRSLEEWRAVMSRIELTDPDSRRHVPGLIGLMNDPAVPWITRRQAALTLGRLGPLAREAIPHVMRHLDESDADDPEASPQRWALSALALFGRAAADAAPRLVAMLSDRSNSSLTRLGCLETLSQIGSAAPAAVPAVRAELERHLTQTSEMPEEELALGAAAALGMIGPDASAAVPVLMRAAQCPSETLRREAVQALGRIGSAARDAQSLLCDALLMDEALAVRDAAATALGQTGPSAWPLIEPLLSAEEADVRERAVKVLGGWKSAAKSIVPSLEPLLRDHEPHVRLSTARSLRTLTNRHDLAWPVLVELLADPDRDLRRGASRELQEIARSQTIRTEELQQLARDPRAAVRSEGLRLQRLQRDREWPVD